MIVGEGAFDDPYGKNISAGICFAELGKVCSKTGSASVGSLGDLLPGGDHLPILDFLEDGADLAGGYWSCNGERRNHYFQGSKEEVS